MIHVASHGVKQLAAQRCVVCNALLVRAESPESASFYPLGTFVETDENREPCRTFRGRLRVIRMPLGGGRISMPRGAIYVGAFYDRQRLEFGDIIYHPRFAPGRHGEPIGEIAGESADGFLWTIDLDRQPPTAFQQALPIDAPGFEPSGVGIEESGAPVPAQGDLPGCFGV